MIISNIIALLCFISVNGNEIPIKEGNKGETQYNCSSPARMTVTGFDIRTSDVINHDCWTNASDIQIFALNKIFIDCDVIKYGGQLSIYAPIWEPVGVQHIIVSGEDGEPHKVQTVPGRNGEPGLPGGAGGIFIGVVHRFINLHKIKIQANGGNGGPGQNGANGYGGINGDEHKEQFTIDWNSYDFEIFLKKYEFNFTRKLSNECNVDGNCYQIFEYDINGKKATSSGDGGDGGVGGFGGPAGLIYFKFDYDFRPKIISMDGKSGKNGKAGFAGNPAHSGRHVKCKFIYSGSFMNSFHCEWSDSEMGAVGNNGVYGGNRVNRKNPPVAITAKYEEVLNSFKEFVRMNLVKKGIKSDSTGFINNL